MRLKVSQGSVTVIQKMVNYQEESVKLTNTQLKELKSYQRFCAIISMFNKRTTEQIK